jgi:predicted fused transcriptional regulator/phosphomethylpyrimidine kinase
MGAYTDWGAEYAITEAGSVPQVIWDAGGVGKEAMVRILGHSAVEVAGLAIRVVECKPLKTLIERRKSVTKVRRSG